MILRLILIAIVAIFIYRLFGGGFPTISRRKPKGGKDEEHNFGKVQVTSECAECGTYMTEDDAIIYHKRAYCSSECLQKAQRRS
jgi:hypothetical protein